MRSEAPPVTGLSSPSADVRPAGPVARPAAWMIASAVCALLAALVSAYLVYTHYQPAALVCDVVNGCETVQSSEYSTVGPIPIALLGLGMYLVSLGLGWLRWRRPALAEPITIALFGLVLAAIAYFAYLTYIEIFVLEAICQWCVITSIFTVGMAIAEGIGLWKLFGVIEAED